MTASHTKGPWLWHSETATKESFVILATDMPSRSPEEAILALDGTTVENEKLVDDYRAAIAKARGE